MDVPGRRVREPEQRDLAGLPLVGGVATGLSGPGGTRLLIDGRVVSRGAVGLLISGGATVTTLVSQGCRPVGPTMTVTAAEGNLVLTLAGRPALDKLREVVASLDPDDQLRAASGLQLGIAMDEYAEEHGQGDFLVRGLVGRRRRARCGGRRRRHRGG